MEMLAAAAHDNSLGDWILGILFVVAVLSLIAWFGRRALRLARRFRPVSTTADIAALVPRESQPKTRPPTSQWRRPMLVPAWLVMPVLLLGLAFVVLKPLGRLDWFGYTTSLVVALLYGLWIARRTRARRPQ
jgi:hypothetical protein